ncbi:MAG: DUF3883 domain-containing protein [Gemmatimonadota bacterium]|nr:DUF3883 domain-containing protein [Gemmatimonadota bacterium]
MLASNGKKRGRKAGLFEEFLLIPTRPRRGVARPSFRGRRRADYAAQDARNRALGRAGDRLVVEREQQALRAADREDLVPRVRHVAEIEGDGAGFDVESVRLDGRPKYIEVKTTRGPTETSFFMSASEIAFAQAHASEYYLCRVFYYNDTTVSGRMYVREGNPEAYFQLDPTQYRLQLPPEAD